MKLSATPSRFNEKDVLCTLHQNTHALLTLAQAPTLQRHINTHLPFQPEAHVQHELIAINQQLPQPITLDIHNNTTLADWLHYATQLAYAFQNQIIHPLHDNQTLAAPHAHALWKQCENQPKLNRITLPALRHLCAHPPLKNKWLNYMDPTTTLYTLTGACAATYVALSAFDLFQVSPILNTIAIATGALAPLTIAFDHTTKSQVTTLPTHILKDLTWQQLLQSNPNPKHEALRAWLISHIMTLNTENQQLITLLPPYLCAKLLDTIDTLQLDTTPTLHLLKPLALQHQALNQNLCIPHHIKIEEKVTTPLDI